MGTFTNKYGWVLKWVPVILVAFSAIAWAVKADFRISVNEKCITEQKVKFETVEKDITSLKENRASQMASLTFLVAQVTDINAQMTEMRKDIKELLKKGK